MSPSKAVNPGVLESPWTVGEGIGDTDHVVVNVLALSLASRAKVVIVAYEALEASTLNGPIAAIAHYSRVNDTFLLLGLPLL